MTAGPAAVTVRPARTADVGPLVDLFAAVAAEGRWIAAEAPVDRDRRRERYVEAIAGERSGVLVADERSGVLVAEAGGRIVGEITLRLARYGVADVGMLVADGWRGLGVGSALLAAGIDWSRRAGAHKLSLEVWPDNAAALALYGKFGFEREGYLRGHYRRRSGELWDAVVMGLLLDADQPAQRPDRRNGRRR